MVCEKVDRLKFGEDCVICLCELDVGEKIIALSCNHYFHNKCLMPWLRKSNKCPLCVETVELRSYPVL